MTGDKMDLVTIAHRHVIDMVGTLTGEDDFLPFMTFAGPGGNGYVGLMMPEEEGKNTVADTMMAMLMVHRATEAIFASVVWIAPMDNRPGQPKDHPDRQEHVLLLHVTPDGDLGQTAPLTRTGGRVSLGTWEEIRVGGGRFAEAMHTGMSLGAKMPQQLIEVIDEQIKDGADLQAILNPVLHALHHVREMKTQEERSQ